MSSEFQTYKPRKIEFNQLLKIDDWSIKIYTITLNSDFESKQILESALKEIPNWITSAQNSILKTHKNAFLILHEGREGVWILMNWWTDGEMLETKVYFGDYDSPNKVKETIYKPKSLICTWELAVIIHERKAWMEHVLLNSNSPKFEDYKNDVLLSTYE
jgi:hypothetical protein